MESKFKVLVLHALRPTSRQTTIDHIGSFRSHLADCDVQYLHFQQPISGAAQQTRTDLLIVNYDFLNYRFTPLWPFIRNRYIKLAKNAGKVVAIAQDDFWANKLLDNWCMKWEVDRILTPIDTDREVLYPRSIKSKEFRTGLTGYVKSGPVPATPPLRDRKIDLGQRVRDMPPHLGRLAQAKARQAVSFAESARRSGFIVDVSTRVEDSFIGTAWFDFLASCKFTVGMKGGASLHDPWGLTHTKVESFCARRPGATFDEIERHCFKGKDMQHQFTAISPRLFEAALAGTCQILQRDDYLGVLEPWRDYIPLEPDLSNIDEVLDVMTDLDRCQAIADSARVRLVDSGIFDYRRLAEEATDGLLQTPTVEPRWNSLVNELRESEAIFRRFGADQHDACLNLIIEMILKLKKQEFSTFVSSVLNVSSSEEIELPGAGRSEQLATREVLRDIVERNAQRAFVNLATAHRHDNLSWRAPWTWRPFTEAST